MPRTSGCSFSSCSRSWTLSEESAQSRPTTRPSETNIASVPALQANSKSATCTSGAIPSASMSAVPLGLTALVAQLNQACIAMGDGELDYIATVRLLERLSGLNLPEAPAAG